MKKVNSKAVDTVVIGSSPLMLLQAIKSANSGKSCIVLHHDENPGGLWQNITLDDGTIVEGACHLIDDFPGVYETLTNVTGCKFETMYPTPKRVYWRYFKEDYMSRFTTLKMISKDVIGLTIFSLQKAIQPKGFKRLKALETRKIRLRDTRFTFKRLLTGYNVSMPTVGYGNFMSALLSAALKSGVTLVKASVTKAERSDGVWQISTTGQNQYTAEEIFCTSTANLRQTNPNLFEHFDAVTTQLYHLYVAVPKQAIVMPLSYVTLPTHPFFKRITKVDSLQESETIERYILQVRSSSAREKSYHLAQAKLLFNELRIANDLDSITLQSVTMQKVRSFQNETPLIDGKLAPDFTVLSSDGNLASGIANWQNGTYRHPRESA